MTSGLLRVEPGFLVEILDGLVELVVFREQIAARHGHGEILAERVALVLRLEIVVARHGLVHDALRGVGHGQVEEDLLLRVRVLRRRPGCVSGARAPRRISEADVTGGDAELRVGRLVRRLARASRAWYFPGPAKPGAVSSPAWLRARAAAWNCCAIKRQRGPAPPASPRLSAARPGRHRWHGQRLARVCPGPRNSRG